MNDIDDTARLILMDGVNDFGEFWRRIRREVFTVDFYAARDTWHRYMGISDVFPATHDYITGRRL